MTCAPEPALGSVGSGEGEAGHQDGEVGIGHIIGRGIIHEAGPDPHRVGVKVGQGPEVRAVVWCGGDDGVDIRYEVVGGVFQFYSGEGSGAGPVDVMLGPALPELAAVGQAEDDGQVALVEAGDLHATEFVVVEPHLIEKAGKALSDEQVLGIGVDDGGVVGAVGQGAVHVELEFLGPAGSAIVGQYQMMPDTTGDAGREGLVVESGQGGGGGQSQAVGASLGDGRCALVAQGHEGARAVEVIVGGLEPGRAADTGGYADLVQGGIVILTDEQVVGVGGDGAGGGGLGGQDPVDIELLIVGAAVLIVGHGHMLPACANGSVEGVGVDGAKGLGLIGPQLVGSGFGNDAGLGGSRSVDVHGHKEAVIAGALVGHGIGVIIDLDQVEANGVTGFELQGIDDGVGDEPAGGYLDRLQEAISAITLVGDGKDIIGDRDDLGGSTIAGIEREGIDHRVGDSTVGGYLHGLDIAIVARTLVDHCIVIARDLYEVLGLGISGIELQGVNDRVGDHSVSSDLYRLEEAVRTISLVGDGVIIA